MKTILRLVLVFATLMGFLSSSQCIAKNTNGYKDIETVTTDSSRTVLFISPFLDSCPTDLNISKDSKNVDSSDVDFLKSVFLLNTAIFNTNYSNAIEKSLKNKQFLLGSMVPITNIPKYILFHTLQIDF